MKKMSFKYFAIILVITSIAVFGCGKKDGSKTDDKKETTTNPIDTKQRTEDSIKQVQKEQAEKEQKIKDALADEKILNDTLGQWAIDAEVSSTYGDENATEKTAPYTKFQLIGKPDVENYSDNGKAWTSKEADKGVEWCKVTFAKPVNATEVRIRQNYGPGAIIKVELVDTDGKMHSVWEGPDKTQYKENTIQYLLVKFEKTTYKVKSVKITLATNAVPGWNEIDAVQLVGQ
jgi:hypothetical protein